MRTYTLAQGEALASQDRTTFVQVWFQDSDGALRNVCNLLGEDFFDSCTIDANTDQPISSATFTLKRKSGQHSLVPLDEDSLINRDSGGSYAPFLNPYRYVRVEVATLATDAGAPVESDFVYLWQGITDDVDWGGESTIRVRARDPMARLNDTFIESEATYGNDGGGESVEEVAQEILTAYISSPSMTLSYTATSQDVREYDLANVTVLAALQELVDMIGWNLTWKWDSSASDLRLTLWQPSRSSTASLYSFGPDDYYMIPRTSLNLEGIRNAGEVVYLTAAGIHSTATETRTASVALYGRRFIRIDARGTSVVTSTQAANLLDAVLDDLEEPNVQQEVDCAFFWPCELGDVYAFTPNDHYSTTQTYAVFGYRHVLSGTQKRTYLTVAGKPSGGYQRWHDRETGWVGTATQPTYENGTVIHVDTTSRSHTGDTNRTTKQTVQVPALYVNGVLNAVRLKGLFSSSGAGGGKDFFVVYGGNPGHSATVAAGNQKAAIDITVQAVDADTVSITYNLADSYPAAATYTPIAADEVQNITFDVDLANAGDTAVLQMSEVTWLGTSV